MNKACFLDSRSGNANLDLLTQALVPQHEMTMAVLSAGNKPLLDRMVQCSQDEDDPLIWFDWHVEAIEAFIRAARALPVPPPPPAIAPAIAAALAPGQRIATLQVGLLNHAIMACQPAPTALVDVGHSGLACTTRQYGQSIVQLTLLAMSPWCQAVIAAQGAAAAPLATLWIPRPGDATGICDRVLSIPLPLFD